jgi:hypothetical protein
MFLLQIYNVMDDDDFFSLVIQKDFYKYFKDEDWKWKDQIKHIFDNYDIDPDEIDEYFNRISIKKPDPRANIIEYLGVKCCEIDDGEALYSRAINHLVTDPDKPTEDQEKVNRFKTIKNETIFHGLKFNNEEYKNNNPKATIDKEDDKYLFVKCNNPHCDKYFRINLWDLIYTKQLFCCDKCRTHTSRIIPKLIRHKKVCKKCNRIFFTYDNTREYCNTYCEFVTPKLTPYRYKEYIRSFDKKRSMIATIFIDRTDLNDVLKDFDTSILDGRFIEAEIKRLKDAKEAFNKYNKSQKSLALLSCGVKRRPRGNYKSSKNK